MILTNEIQYPKSFKTPQLLRWLRQEVEDLIIKHKVNSIVLKAPEPMANKDKSYSKLIECETVFLLVGAMHNLRSVDKKVKATMAKDLGVKGKAKYLSTINTSIIPNFSDFSEKLQEAIYAGWSGLT